MRPGAALRAPMAARPRRRRPRRAASSASRGESTPGLCPDGRGRSRRPPAAHRSARGCRCRVSTHLMTAPPPGHSMSSGLVLPATYGRSPRGVSSSKPCRWSTGKIARVERVRKDHGVAAGVAQRVQRRFDALLGLQRLYAGVRGDVHDAVRVGDAVAGREQDRDRRAAPVDEADAAVGERATKRRVRASAEGTSGFGYGTSSVGTKRRLQALDLPPRSRRLRERAGDHAEAEQHHERADRAAAQPRARELAAPRRPSAARAPAPMRRTGT